MGFGKAQREMVGWLRGHWLLLLSGLVLLTTYVVKEGLAEKLKSFQESLGTATNLFVIERQFLALQRQDVTIINQLREDIRGLDDHMLTGEGMSGDHGRSSDEIANDRATVERQRLYQRTNAASLFDMASSLMLENALTEMNSFTDPDCRTVKLTSSLADRRRQMDSHRRSLAPINNDIRLLHVVFVAHNHLKWKYAVSDEVPLSDLKARASKASSDGDLLLDQIDEIVGKILEHAKTVLREKEEQFSRARIWAGVLYFIGVCLGVGGGKSSE